MSFDGGIPGVYSSIQDAILNPAQAASLFVRLAAGSPDYQLLPDAPLGKVWIVFNANVIAEGATPAWSFRELVTGEPVRVLDQRTGTSAGSYLQIGAFAAVGRVMAQNNGPSAIAYTATVVAVPADLAQRFWLSLTNVFAPVPFAVPRNTVLRVAFGGYSQGTNSVLWINNTDVSSRQLELRITRAATAVVISATATTAANSRATWPFPAAAFFPALMPGDLLEARTTVVPNAPVYLGGLLQTVPQLGI